MSTAQTLRRADLAGFSGYKSARSDTLKADIVLNANEFPWSNPADATGACRRYPDPQPGALLSAMAGLYGVAPEQILLGRGSDEGIELLLRTFCAPGRGTVLIAPPVFGMYAVCARLHGAQVVEVPLLDTRQGFKPDLGEMAALALRTGATVLFLCTPGNPTGEAISLEDISRVARQLHQHCLVVVDEAYGEFCETGSSVSLLPAHDNIVVLKTLSKAYALAGARVGAVIAHPTTIEAMRASQAPYPIPEPVVSLAMAAISNAAVAETRTRVEQVKRLRDALSQKLAVMPGVRRVYPSQANFVLVRLVAAEQVLSALRAAGILVRDMRAMPGLGDAIRITVGDESENARVLEVMKESMPLQRALA